MSEGSRAFKRITDNAPVEVLKRPDPSKRLPAPASRKSTKPADNEAAQTGKGT